MRLFFKFVISVVAIFLVATGGFYYWLAFYNGGLPDISSLEQFSPANQTTATDNCINASITVLPSNAFGKHLPNAITTAEDFDTATAVLKTFLWTPRDLRPHHSLPIQLARLLICNPGKSLDFQFKTIRLAVRLERKFSNDQLLTIYLNHVYFGQDLQGVFAASQAYFGKTPDQLNLAESATLAGLIRAPNLYLNHPDKLVSRRNEVIEKLASAGKISQEEKQTAEPEPIPNLNGPATKKR